MKTDKNKKLLALKSMSIRLNTLPIEEQIRLVLELHDTLERIVPRESKELLKKLYKTLVKLDQNGNETVKQFKEIATKQIIGYLQQYIDAL
jgi:uncharacterized protein YaaW (UPF0174 family)